MTSEKNPVSKLARKKTPVIRDDLIKYKNRGHDQCVDPDFPADILFLIHGMVGEIRNP